MFTNGKVTLYSLADGVYQRIIIDAFYSSTKISKFDKIGLSTSGTAIVYIPHKGVDLTFTTGKDFIVNGECLLELDNSTPQKLSESLKALKEYDFVTIISVDPKLYGSVNMWHYHLSCK